MNTKKAIEETEVEWAIKYLETISHDQWGEHHYINKAIPLIITMLKSGEAYKKKAGRIEKIILDYSLWLKANHKTMKIKDAAIYWKKLVEDYVFEGVKKVIVALSKATEKGAKSNEA